MRVRDIMTTPIVTLSPDTPVREVARLLVGRGVSGAPVVDAEGRLLGVVTEGDVIHRLSTPEDRPRSWILAFCPWRRGRRPATPAPTAAMRAT